LGLFNLYKEEEQGLTGEDLLPDLIYLGEEAFKVDWSSYNGDGGNDAYDADDNVDRVGDETC